MTLVELLTGPLAAGNLPLAERHRDLFLNTAGFVLSPVTTVIAERAAGLRAKYRLRTPDAVIVATALEAECELLLTNDERWTAIDEVRVLYLEQFITGGTN